MGRDRSTNQQRKDLELDRVFGPAAQCKQAINSEPVVSEMAIFQHLSTESHVRYVAEQGRNADSSAPYN